MSIQILQYEFLGPIKLGEWGPPMEKVVYLILTRTRDSFNIVFVGDCEKTKEKSYFIDNPNFKCWIQSAGSEDSLYLAILPMFESDSSARKGVLDKIILRYHPICNTVDNSKQKPDYVIRSRTPIIDSEISLVPENKISCPCCGSSMTVDKVLENNTILKCSGCGLTDTRIN